MNTFFDDILDCLWRWHRYEWQNRSTIHAHGCACLKNDPGLIKLTVEVYKGRLAAKLNYPTTNKPLPRTVSHSIEKAYAMLWLTLLWFRVFRMVSIQLRLQKESKSVV